MVVAVLGNRLEEFYFDISRVGVLSEEAGAGYGRNASFSLTPVTWFRFVDSGIIDLRERRGCS